MLVIKTTKEKLASAFEQWAIEYENNPQSFTADIGEPKEYGKACAEQLIKLLENGEGKNRREAKG